MAGEVEDFLGEVVVDVLVEGGTASKGKVVSSNVTWRETKTRTEERLKQR
jgi:hypothetical protein